ncbi:response regulator [Planococcus maritimus]|uniref:Response regulator n=1 Tax=Planococcus maritimus TaxID=192421 RepID=A0A7D7M9L8_PLAMR|nr:response regulator [Planococcus maritimus]KYG59588.1 two-component system response regulator [Planococcus maritimus]OED33287.1 two-component system response regulator [Planococcus maritimus]QMT16917.1 response regulator [Planococcus maritimus]
MKRILIVDDQQGIRLLLKEVFEREGYETWIAGSGREALELTEEECPDMVLMDMKMPGMDGIELLKQLKQRQHDCKVIMMTAYGEMGVIEESMNWGVVRYFTKPFDVFELRDAVSELISD